jgi:hypothetical protein
MTLMEVMAGLVILATVLAFVVTARARYLHQAADADARQVAVKAADALLSNWWQDPASVPQNGSGKIDEQLRWETHARSVGPRDELEVDVVRLEVFRSGEVGPDAKPLVSVEVVTPGPKKQQKSQNVGSAQANQ